MIPVRPPVGVVLTGGRSTRMGVDKAVVAFEGVAMARRVADALTDGGCAPVWCQGGDAAQLAAIGLEVRPDPEPDAGPLAAIAAALAAASPADVVVCACDLPALDGLVVAGLVEAGRRSHGAVVSVATDDRGAHLAGWWSAAAAEPLAALRAAGTSSYREAIGLLGAIAVTVPAAAVRNVNRPDDLA
jgi:molybdopterin-guanine dinucleotide biosynthesis protein A